MREKERGRCFCKKIEAPVRLSLPPVVGWAWESCSHLEKGAFPETLRARRTRGDRTGALARGARLSVSRRAWP